MFRTFLTAMLIFMSFSVSAQTHQEKLDDINRKIFRCKLSCEKVGMEKMAKMILTPEVLNSLYPEIKELEKGYVKFNTEFSTVGKDYEAAKKNILKKPRLAANLLEKINGLKKDGKALYDKYLAETEKRNEYLSRPNEKKKALEATMKLLGLYDDSATSLDYSYRVNFDSKVGKFKAEFVLVVKHGKDRYEYSIDHNNEFKQLFSVEDCTKKQLAALIKEKVIILSEAPQDDMPKAKEM